MNRPDLDQPFPTEPALARTLLADAMQAYGFLESPPPPAALRWVDTFVEAYAGQTATLRAALEDVAELRAEATTVPALELERLRTRQVLFFIDTVSQYVDRQNELRGLPLSADVPIMASEFGIAPDDAMHALRMALTGKADGPPFELLFPLLGHDRIMMRIGAVNSHILHGRGLETIPYGPGGVPFEPIAAQRPQATEDGAAGS